MHMSCMHFHSLPSARVISVGPVCDPQNQIGVISLTRMIQKGKARRVDSADTVCVQEYHVHSNVPQRPRHASTLQYKFGVQIRQRAQRRESTS